MPEIAADYMAWTPWKITLSARLMVMETTTKHAQPIQHVRTEKLR